jgi:hypothetical protein
MLYMWGVGGRSGMDDTERRGADYYREKAVEIRQLASRVGSRQVIRDLLATADRFERMAAFVEKWCLQPAN